jgi:4-hydroxybenzoyl-CoA thioesterase
MLTATRTVTVEWGHCDPAGIVFFPRYFEWFDASTAALFEKAGVSKGSMAARFGIVGIPVVETSSRFICPSSFGDRVAIESTIEKWGRSSFRVHHRVFRGDDLAVEAFETRVWTGRDAGGKLRGRPIPADVIALFQDGGGPSGQRNPELAAERRTEI